MEEHPFGANHLPLWHYRVWWRMVATDLLSHTRMSRLFLLSLFATAGYVQLIGGPRVPGPLGQIDAEVRIGMSQAEAVTILRAHDLHGAEAFFTGETRDGKQVAGFSRATLDNLPAGDQMAGLDVSIYDHGRHLEVTFGPGGAVTAVELKSRRWFGETWWLACSRPIYPLIVLGVLVWWGTRRGGWLLALCFGLLSLTLVASLGGW